MDEIMPKKDNGATTRTTTTMVVLMVMMMMTQLHKHNSQGFKKCISRFTQCTVRVRACESLWYYLLIFIYFILFHFIHCVRVRVRMRVCVCVFFALNAFEWKIRFFFGVIMFFICYCCCWFSFVLIFVVLTHCMELCTSSIFPFGDD